MAGSLIRGGIIDCDSAYYICLAQLTSHGYVPYVDFPDGYTPLWTYLAAGLKLLFRIPDGNYSFYLVFHYFLAIGVAFFLYKIARLFGSSKHVAFFGSWSFLLMSHWIEGNEVLLEMPSLFFGLLSVWLTLRFSGKSVWNYVWIGMITAGAFLCKQYGLGFLALNLYLLLAVNRQTWRECVCLLFGFALPILACFAYWGTSFGYVFFNGYGTASAKEAGYDVSIVNKLKAVWSGLRYFCIMVCPAVLVSVLNLPHAYKTKRLGKMLFCYCGILGFSLQFYFSYFLHYMLFMLPFAVLLMTVMMSLVNKSWLRYVNYIVIAFVICVSLYKTYYNRVYKLYVKRNIKQEQIAFSKQVKQIVPDDAQLWIAHGGLYYLYLTTGNTPPHLSYAFGPQGLDEREAFKQAESADFVIRYSADYPYETYFTNSLKHYLEQYRSVPLQDSAVLLHDMSKQINIDE